MSKTFDRLADASRREITTVFPTGIRVNEGTYDAGTVRVALTTSHDKSRKRVEVRINREVEIDSGFVTRSFTLFGGPSADAGLTLVQQPLPRFNATKARDLHTAALADLDLLLNSHRDQGVAMVLAGLLDAAKALA